MMEKEVICLRVNGEDHEVFVSGAETLLTVLRDQLELTGTKRGCNQGVCGACTVTIDGLAVRSCLSIAGFCENTEITTIEGFSKDTELSPIQIAFSETGAVQCGFCTAGMMAAVKALLDVNSTPTIDEVREGISGNLCRCSGYKKIVDAALEAAQLMKSKET